MSHTVRTQVVKTGEIMVNLNDLIIKFMLMANAATSEADQAAYQKIVDYLHAKRESVAHGK